MRIDRVFRSTGLRVLAVFLVMGLAACVFAGCALGNKGKDLALNPEAGGSQLQGTSSAPLPPAAEPSRPGASPVHPPSQASPSTPVSSPPGVSPTQTPSAVPPSTPVSSSPGTSPGGAPSQVEPSGPVSQGLSPVYRPEVTWDPGELVELKDLDDSFMIDLRYATEDNFTGKKIYSQAKCLLVRGTAEKLIAANREFAEMGYRLKIWDAYRPPSAQRALWEAVPDPAYVANPEKGSIHTKGAAVDVTLVDAEGNELPMPTGFDDFSEKAAIDYDGCAEEQARNRELLAEVMVRNDFARIESEWWHFVDNQASRYPMLDVEFEDIE